MGTKISAATNVSPLGTDFLPIYRPGQSASAKFYITPGDLSNRIYASQYGIVGDGEDWTDLLQLLINNNVGREIVIGNSVADVYLISKALVIPSNSRIILYGVLMLPDGNIQLLTANVVGGATSAQVVDASSYRVGQRIHITDDNQPINGGGAWKTRKVSRSNVVSTIVGNTLNFSNPFASNILGSGSFTTAANGKVAIAESIFLIDGVSNVHITIHGELDGNLANNLSVAPSYYTGTAEDLKACSGIMFSNCDHVTIDGLGHVKDFVLHGISTNDNLTSAYSEFYTIRDISIHGQVDKAIAGLWGKNFLIQNVKNYDGVDEGEIIMYNSNTDGNIIGCFSQNNRRYGIASTGQNNGPINIIDCIFDGNRTYDLYLQNALYGTNVVNPIFTGSATQDATFVINSCKNVDVKNIKMNGKTGSSTHLAISANTQYATTSDDIRINGLTIKDSNAGSGRSISYGNTNRLVIQNFSIDGVYRPLNDGSGNGTVKMQNGYFGTRASTLFETDNLKTIFSNVDGITVENASSATIPSGSTSVIINHLMDRTPLAQNISVEAYRPGPINPLGNATKYWFSDITAYTFKINVDVDPGANTAKFQWEIKTYEGTVTAEAVYTTNYASNFSAGVDGWGSTNTVTSGNEDGVSDGTTSYDNNLKTYANVTNSTHDISKAIAFVGKSNRILVRYLIPSGQTNVNGFRIYNSAFTVIGEVTFGATPISSVVGTWTEYTTGHFVPAGTTIYIRLMKTFTTSYAGANSASDDRIFFESIVAQYLP